MKERHFKLLRWAPVVASGVHDFDRHYFLGHCFRVKKATYWREHTFQEVLDAQALEDKLVDAQSSVHEYARKGQANLVLEYKSDTNIDLQEFKQLADLARDNPEQQKRFQDLATAVKAVFA